MDNLTHTLTGLMMSRAGLGRMCPRGGLILMLAANIPDMDAVSALRSAAHYLDHHRGPTHSFLYLPLVALVPVLVVGLFRRRGFPWWKAWLLSMAGVASHLLLDWTNMYGVRLLEPVSRRWYSLDITSVVDVWIWTLLLVAWLWPLLARLVSLEIGARPRGGAGLAIAALALLVVYESARLVLHTRAVEILNARLYNGAEPRRAYALPNAANPLRWTGVVETRSFHMVHNVDLTRSFDPSSGRIIYKPESSEAIRAASSSYPFQVFLRFSRAPAWQVVPVPEPDNGSRVEVCDLRFGLPGEGNFTATAILDSGLRVQRSWFQFSPPRGMPKLR